MEEYRIQNLGRSLFGSCDYNLHHRSVGIQNQWLHFCILWGVWAVHHRVLGHSKVVPLRRLPQYNPNMALLWLYIPQEVFFQKACPKPRGTTPRAQFWGSHGTPKVGPYTTSYCNPNKAKGVQPGTLTVDVSPLVPGAPFPVVRVQASLRSVPRGNSGSCFPDVCECILYIYVYM